MWPANFVIYELHCSVTGMPSVVRMERPLTQHCPREVESLGQLNVSSRAWTKNIAPREEVDV